MSTASTSASVLLISNVPRACMCGHVLLVCSHAYMHPRRAGARRVMNDNVKARRALRNEAGATVSNLWRGERFETGVFKVSRLWTARMAAIFRADICSPSARNVFASQSCVARAVADWKGLRYFTPTRARCLSNSLESTNRRNIEIIWRKTNDDPPFSVRTYCKLLTVLEKSASDIWFQKGTCNLSSFSLFLFFFLSRNAYCKAYERRTRVPCEPMHFYRPIWHAKAIFNGKYHDEPRHAWPVNQKFIAQYWCHDLGWECASRVNFAM